VLIILKPEELWSTLEVLLKQVGCTIWDVDVYEMYSEFAWY